MLDRNHVTPAKRAKVAVVTVACLSSSTMRLQAAYAQVKREGGFQPHEVDGQGSKGS
jgi:hypothetical protein